MSLKAFHLVFILAATALASWVCVWCFQRYAANNDQVLLASGIASAVAGAGLIWYAFRFISKFRNVKYY